MKKIILMGALLLSLTAFGKDYSQYKSDSLISPKVAKEMIEKDKNVVVIDVRPKAKYLLGNVDGSYNLWRPDMEAKDGRYGEIVGMRASRAEMEEVLNKMGVNNDTTLILLGEGLDEYRLWWILDLYGMDNVKIVDGGFNALKAEGIKVSLGSGAKEKKGDFRFTAKEDKNTLAQLEDVKAGIKDKNTVIIDARSKEEYDGKVQKKGAFAQGRIPKAIWIEWTEATNKDTTIKSYNELVELYSAKGVTPDKDVIAYCQSAAKSSHTTFVLKELLGYPNVKNYDGSWIEWSHEVSKGNVEAEVGE